MKTFRNEAALPAAARYIGMHPPGSMDESLANDIDRAIDPCRLVMTDGWVAYFELAQEVTE